MENEKQDRLGRSEAIWVSKWLESIGKKLRSGYLDCFRLTPAEIAAEFKVNENDVIKAARRTDYPTDYSYEK